MLSQMFMQLFVNDPLVALPSLALALFMAVFTVVVVRVAARKAAAFDDVARLPLDDQEDGR